MDKFTQGLERVVLRYSLKDNFAIIGIRPYL